MGIDKLRAEHEKWRIPESTLFIVSLLGGSLGGFLGMRIYHHKTKKASFYIIYALALILHIALLYFVLTNFDLSFN